jgi:hypothetical protein
MTLPIVPGPFSFLAQLGQAGGEAFAAAERDRVKKRKEDQDRLNQMIELRGQGLLAPDAFGTPEAMSLYKRLGVLPVSSEATPDEQIRKLRGEFISSSQQPDNKINLPIASLGIGGVDQQLQLPATARFTDDQRRLIGQPSTDELAIERAKGEVARAQIPEVGTTTAAEQLSTQDTQFNQQADRIVADLFTATGKMPTDVEAFQAAQSDARYQKFGSRKITQPYFGDAIQRLKDRLANQETARLGARARYLGASGEGLDDVDKMFSRRIDQLNTELKQLPTTVGIKDSDQYAVSAARDYRAKGKKVPQALLDAEARVQRFTDETRRINLLIQEYGETGQKLRAEKLGIPSPPPGGEITAEAKTTRARQQWDLLAQQYGEERTTKEVGPRP